MVLDPAFDYLQPYFYNNPWALRCELGVGDGADYMRSARRRADEIREILLPRGADMMFFNYWLRDWSDSGPAGSDAPEDIERYLDAELKSLRFLFDCMQRYRHVSVRGLRTYAEPGDPDFDTVRRNRIVCYADGDGLDDRALIERQLTDDGLEISLVSFENECILSVYDDRGCDVVFADRAHMLSCYDRLRPYFLEYDLAEMERRKNQT